VFVVMELIVGEFSSWSDDFPSNACVMPDFSPCGGDVVGSWTAPMHAGETRTITLEFDGKARGGLTVYIEAGEGRAYWSANIEPSTEELTKPWTVIDRRSKADRRAMVPKGAIKKTLERLRRYAARSLGAPAPVEPCRTGARSRTSYAAATNSEVPAPCWPGRGLAGLHRWPAGKSDEE
jgi:hypothetical protein